ncbi:PIN-like domain-containing protein [Paenibacillus sp. FSL H8-0457]|uniref:PIN-like domain-containing protein n=1 Tax=unclassified Paenibacillus TaxID=185978 RepID=UPI0003E25F50|nr:PIN-like domain-containing protein [Paenibacillus sp. FSL H8-457]ETT58162.1 hypothetical protein C172_27483 [Paenibacillus sp. FSL H8-457]
MDPKDIEQYMIPSKDKEKEMWENCIFVFDTSALLQFYYFPKTSQQEIFDSTFNKLIGRLWIPGHVNFEYLKNRDNTLKKPIEEKYKKLETEHIRTIENNIKEIKNKMNDFINHTKNTDAHPYIINNEISIDFEKVCNELETRFSKFKTEVESEFKKREEEINAFAEQDTVLEAFNTYFEVGKEYDYTKILEIVSEGEVRYRNQIPPGFKDGSEKEGTQKYGDLIIWKQIIDFATIRGKTIIFITNDVKPDWCYSYKRSNEIRIERPKEDLIREIRDSAKVDFWMYTFSQFLYVAKEILDTKIDQQVINEAAKPKSDVYMNKYIRFDGFYRAYSLTDDVVEHDFDEESEYESISAYYDYCFYEDGTVDMINSEGSLDSGQYKLSSNGRIEIEVKTHTYDITIKGRISKSKIILTWDNGSYSGSESGNFIKNKAKVS